MNAYEAMADVYDQFMYDVDYDEWVAYLISLLQKHHVNPGAEVLETACGTGNLTWRLAKEYRITANDISTSMLNVAASKLLAHGRRAKLISGDMAALTLPHPVDAVICACDGVNYLAPEQTAAYFRHAYQLLKVGGVLLFDISSVYKYTEILSDNVFCDEGEDAAVIWTNHLDGQRCIMDITLFLKEGELFRRESEQHVHYLHSEADIRTWLKQAGFLQIESYACFHQKPPSPQSERIEFSAIKGETI